MKSNMQLILEQVSSHEPSECKTLMVARIYLISELVISRSKFETRDLIGIRTVERDKT